MCDPCLNNKGLTRNRNVFKASNLPNNQLSEYIEKRLNLFIERNMAQGVAGYVHIRCLYNKKKNVKENEGIKRYYFEILYTSEENPHSSSSIPLDTLRSKLIISNQKSSSNSEKYFWREIHIPW